MTEQHDEDEQHEEQPGEHEPEHVAHADQGEQAAPAVDGLTDVRLTEAVQRLGGLGGRPPEEHAEVYEDVHATLQQALADAQADRPRA